MSPLTKFAIMQLIYKYFIRDIIIQKIKLDITYANLLKFTDYIIDYKVERKDGDLWYGQQ
jgi:hypothetical protein